MTPAGVGAMLRHVEGTGGPPCGPIPPHDTPNSSGLHASLQVKPLAQPPLDEHPGLTIADPGHCVGSLLRHAAPAPLAAVQLTNARAAPHP